VQVQWGLVDPENYPVEVLLKVLAVTFCKMHSETPRWVLGREGCGVRPRLRYIMRGVPAARMLRSTHALHSSLHSCEGRYTQLACAGRGRHVRWHGSCVQRQR
jgi:hypothetical protein